ncbi:uncharacterized protein LTR77_006270 [Saxophila tyrrhenica]|uniref:Ribosomal protein S17 n=1 Tax=Saxophila tyrrhenica TaxID=1690608 RepID=A0AAV9P7E5_9PEZI|nr:hypothetical protein LTR77_006270 [Saxophila tyrrhenica]
MPPPPQQKKDADEASEYDPTLLSSQRDYRLTTTDFYLKRGLPQRIPDQYLAHSTSPILAAEERKQRETVQGHKRLVGVVVSSGKMDKTVKVRLPKQRWNKRIHKYFATHESHLVHDPNNSLRTGDVVQLHRLRVSTIVHHVVASILSPFGSPISERPPVPTADDRLAMYKKKRFAKLHRRGLRREAAKGNADAIQELRKMGLEPGKGVEAGKGETANLQRGIGKKRTPTPKDGAILGAKGQKLPEGVLPGGKHEVGKINERAQANKDKTAKRQAQTEENLAEADRKGEELAEQGLEAESVVEQERQGPVSRREGVRENVYGSRP